ncbi:MAG: hypothetical protein HC764_25360 [Pleurocapsa sp. CRU_1_2]|nr:hypothetical protein [Pleurocapsa sp. CRU_1_2]
MSLGAGIYHIQIQGRSLQDLGCWCGSDQYDLPSLANEDDDLANYCYTILGNESTESFMAASQNLAISRQRIKSMLSSLQLKISIFPDWLNRASLLEKLEAFLQVSSSGTKIRILESIPTPPIFPLKPSQDIVAINGNQFGKWYSVQTRDKGGKVFCDSLQNIRKQNNVRDLILDFRVLKSLGDSNYILLRLSNYTEALKYIKQIDCFKKIEPRPLTIDQVNEKLGVDRNAR